MQAVVLVGGEGTRLRPLTYTTPKQLLPVVEVPMLERVLAHLGRHGVDRAVLSLGYRPDAFLAAYPDGKAAGVALEYAVEPTPLDTAGAIRFAARHAGIGECFVVVNGDVLTDLDVGSLVRFHRRSGAAATIALTPVEDPSRYGVVDTDPSGRVLAFVEKPAPGEAPSNLVNAGTYVLEPGVLERIAADRPVSVEREVFPVLAAESSLFAQSSDAYWLDTGTPAAYLQAHTDLLRGVRGGPPAPGARLVSPGVWVLGAPTVRGEVRDGSLVGTGALVEDGAVVTGSVVGASAVVAAGATIEGSVVLPGARIGRGARVVRSIVGHGANVGDGSEIRDLTVVGDGAAVPAGARLRSARVPVETVS